MVGTADSIPLLATTANLDAAAQQAYAAHFHNSDFWANQWRAIGASGIYTGAELVNPETFRRSQFFNDYCKSRGLFHFLGAGVTLNPAFRLLLVAFDSQLKPIDDAGGLCDRPTLTPT